MDEVARKIGPTLAKELAFEYDPDRPDRLFAHKAATDICPTAMTHCVGHNQQYTSYDECYDFLTVQRPWGGAMEGGLDVSLRAEGISRAWTDSMLHEADDPMSLHPPEHGPDPTRRSLRAYRSFRRRHVYRPRLCRSRDRLPVQADARRRQHDLGRSRHGRLVARVGESARARQADDRTPDHGGVCKLSRRARERSICTDSRCPPTS